jgi:hypothetical protein
MHFVDDIYLEATAAWRVQGAFQQFTHIVYLRVRCGIQFDQVDEAPAIDFPAGAAFAARCGRDSGHAIQGLRKDSRNSGLADPARTGKQIGVMQAVLRECIAQCAYHMLLSRQLGEASGTPFTS